MVLTVSAALLLGIAAYFTVRTKAANGAAAVVLFLFGFFTAGTGAYGPIHDLCAALAASLADLR
ncbi:hypothetical protein ACIP9H_14960 [Streptomyces sp. NPDC088732]|uniref:hypothetical protein n=1 Tax=Streptomyces sp. NPDC088732 TaxID=3365879 RepID=UPI00382750F4